MEAMQWFLPSLTLLLHESYVSIAVYSKWPVGIGMRSHSGVAAQMFEALANSSINIQMISTSEIKTAVIIQEEDLEKAANIVHEAFNL